MTRWAPLLPGGGHGYRFDPTPYLSDEALAEGLRPCGSPLNDMQLGVIVQRIAVAFQAMKRDQQGLPSAWLPAGEWAAYLGEGNSVYDALLGGAIEEAVTLLSQFWRNSLGVIVKEYATFETLQNRQDERSSRFEHNMVRNWLVWRALTEESTAALASPPVGNPWGYAIEGTVVAPKACRYHLVARELSGMIASLSHPIAVEIGGGYGGLGEFFLRQNPHATWIDFDLPEIAVIASFFHLCARGGDNVVLYGEGKIPQNRSDLLPGKTYFLPNYAIRDLESRTADATVNMFSLSEVGPEPLDAYCRRIEAITDTWFLHHNMDRSDVVNRGHTRIPASKFTISPLDLKLVLTGFDPFHGIDGDYRWYLHKRPSLR